MLLGTQFSCSIDTEKKATDTKLANSKSTTAKVRVAPPPSETEIDAWALKQQRSIINWTAAQAAYAFADDNEQMPAKCTDGKGTYAKFWKPSLKQAATAMLQPRARMTDSYIAGNPMGTSRSQSKDGCEPLHASSC